MITDKTKLIVLNFPGNPTGVVPSVAELDQIVALAEKHSLWILSDEIIPLFLMIRRMKRSSENIHD